MVLARPGDTSAGMGCSGGTIPATTFPSPVVSDTLVAGPCGVTDPELLRHRSGVQCSRGTALPDAVRCRRRSIPFGTDPKPDELDCASTIDSRRRPPDVDEVKVLEDRLSGPKSISATEPSGRSTAALAFNCGSPPCRPGSATESVSSFAPDGSATPGSVTFSADMMSPSDSAE